MGSWPLETSHNEKSILNSAYWQCSNPYEALLELLLCNETQPPSKMEDDLQLGIDLTSKLSTVRNLETVVLAEFTLLLVLHHPRKLLYPRDKISSKNLTVVYC